MPINEVFGYKIYQGGVPILIPVSQCRAKGGPTTCRFHSPMMLNGISSLIASAKTDKEKQEYEYQKECIERTIDMHKKSQLIYRKLYNSIKEIEVNGTEDGEHPETISFGDYSAKIIRASNLSDNAVKALENAKLASPQMYELDAESGGAKLFHNLMKTTKISNKHAAAVYVYSEDEYKNMKLFISDDKRSGYALKWQDDEQTYDIVSVFSMKKSPINNDSEHQNDIIHTIKKKIDEGEKPVLQALLMNAIANGGRMLDCFDTVLPSFYASVGFKQIDYDAWNEKYRPDGWREEDFKNYNHGHPGVVYMKYDGEPWKAPNMNDINIELL